MSGTFTLRLYLLTLLLFFPGIPVNAQGEEATLVLETHVNEGKVDTSQISRCLRMGEYYAAKYDAGPREGDSILSMAAQIDNISRKRRYQRGIGLSLLLQAKGLRLSGRQKEETALAQEAQKILSIHGKPEEYISALIEWGGTFSNDMNALPEKIAIYSKAAALHGQQHNILEQARTLEFVGDLYHIKGEYDKSLQLLNEALRLYKSVGYPGVHGVYALMGAVYSESEEFLKALQYNQLAVTTAEELGDTTPLMTTVYNRLAMNYFDVRALNRAMMYYLKGLRSARSTRDSAAIRNLLFNIAQCDHIAGNYRQALDTLRVGAGIQTMMDLSDSIFYNMLSLKIYLQMNDNDGASPYYKNLLDFYRTRAVSGGQKQMIRVALAQYLQSNRQFGASETYLQSFRQDQGRYAVTMSRTSQYELCASRADSAAGNMTGALLHYQRYKTLSDSLAAIITTRQIGQLQMAFETERKDKDILLLQQKNTIQQSSLRRERTIRYVIIGAVVLLLVFCVMLYNAYHLKKRNNQTLESQQKQLKKLLDEKEWLLKEIHHRVKNNLQMVISLLNSQSAYLDNDAAISAIKNSQHRMYAMSLIHQKLYQTDDLSTINMQWYIRELVNYMEDSFDTHNRIYFNLDVITAEFDVAQAVPVGLILNEVVSNAIKYAFPGGRKGKIFISLRIEHDQYVLCISDNGIGLPDNYDISTSESLGMSLIYGLSQQLEGVLEVKNDDGLCFHIQFATDSQLYAKADVSADTIDVSVVHA